jgi:hypothetical protein
LAYKIRLCLPKGTRLIEKTKKNDR